MLLAFRWEKWLLDVNRTNYAPRFTLWNKPGLSFINYSEVHTPRRLFHWGCLIRTIYATRQWPLTHWNWQGRFDVVSNRFRVYDVTRHSLLVEQGTFPISIQNTNKQSFWSLLMARACGKKTGLFSVTECIVCVPGHGPLPFYFLSFVFFDWVGVLWPQLSKVLKIVRWARRVHSSGAVWESRWTSWAVCPNEPSGFRGRKDLLNRASAWVTTCP